MINDEKIVLAKRKKELGNYLLFIIALLIIDVVFVSLGCLHSIIFIYISLFFIGLTIYVLYKYFHIMKLSDDLIYIIRDYIVFYDENNIKRTYKREEIIKIDIDIIERHYDHKDVLTKDMTVDKEEMTATYFDSNMKIYTEKGNFTVKNVTNANKVKIQILNHK